MGAFSLSLRRVCNQPSFRLGHQDGKAGIIGRLIRPKGQGRIRTHKNYKGVSKAQTGILGTASVCGLGLSRHHKRDYRSPLIAVGGRNLTPMPRNDGPGNRQTEPAAACGPAARLFAAVKLLKNAV